ncbi:hypothetical protein QOZ80_9BG0718400 [Eleusine coracana subsp. coracana]|nr:hypothetical protein QOZ80_9BG0718400 [Eleusine coracana subsp. coracana]
MCTIFGNSMATGKYAKGSNEPLGVDDADEEGGNGVPATTPPPAPTDEQGASSSATRPNKRAKTIDLDVDPLVVAFTSSSERIATAIENLAKGDMDLPADLYTQLKNLPGFNTAHISFSYSYLVADPHIGRAFYNLPFDAKMDWVVQYITDKFPGN